MVWTSSVEKSSSCDFGCYYSSVKTSGVCGGEEGGNH